MKEAIISSWILLGGIALIGFLHYAVLPRLNNRGGFSRSSEAAPPVSPPEFVKKREKNDFHGSITIKDTDIKVKEFNGIIEIK